MTFWDYTKDERDEWRRHSLTQAYLDLLRERDAELGTQALSDILAGRAHEGVVNAGKQEGIVEAVMLMQEER